LTSRLRNYPQLQVLGGVVLAIAVLVMDVLSGLESAPQEAFHHKTVLSYPFEGFSLNRRMIRSVDIDVSVPLDVLLSSKAVHMPVSFTLAPPTSPRTELSGICSAFEVVKLYSALRTGCVDSGAFVVALSGTPLA